MGLRRTSLALYILFIICHLQHNFPSVCSQSSSVATNQETLPFSVSKPDVVGFEGKARELAVVIKRGGGGGRGRGGGSSSRGSGGGSSSRGGGSGGGGGSQPRHGGGVVPIRTSGTAAGFHSSSGSLNLRGAMCALGWFGFLPVYSWSRSV